MSFDADQTERRDAHDECRFEIEQLREQRDDLLEALERIAAGNTKFGPEAEARAAIAKAEGRLKTNKSEGVLK